VDSFIDYAVLVSGLLFVVGGLLFAVVGSIYEDDQKTATGAIVMYFGSGMLLALALVS